MTNVLIIEDDPMVAMLNQQFIEKIADVHIVGNVRNIPDARELLAEESVDLLLLDVYLPGMTGIEFLAELHDKKINVAVILITAANDVSTVKEAIYYGVVDYLIKPFTFERFKLAFEKFEKLTDVTQELQSTDQSQLDKYFNSGTIPTAPVSSGKVEDLPKGLSKLTLKKVYRQIQKIKGSFSTEQLAGEIGLSRISTKKYLLFLIDIQILHEEMEYLEIGRPLTLYSLRDTHQNEIEKYLKINRTNGGQIVGLDYQEIEKIINNETNAGGFAELIKNFKEIGVSHYEYRVAAGMYRYYDEDSSIDIQFNGIPKPVVPIESAEKIKQAVKRAQAGEITFEQFTELAGEAGIAYWATDISKMVVNYYGIQGSLLLSEPISEV